MCLSSGFRQVLQYNPVLMFAFTFPFLQDTYEIYCLVLQSQHQIQFQHTHTLAASTLRTTSSTSVMSAVLPGTTTVLSTTSRPSELALGTTHTKQSTHMRAKSQKITSSSSLSPNRSCDSESCSVWVSLPSSAASAASLARVLSLAWSSAAESLCFLPDTFFSR